MSRSLINAFMTDVIEVTRQTKKGKYVKGKFVESESKIIKIKASVQPDTGKEEDVQDQSHVGDKIKIYTLEPLYTANESEQKGADLINWRGEIYQVIKVKTWTRTDLPHYETIATSQGS